ncbi:hypothetical protein Droror1_Dr00006530 [Drosera rotundifolia]
MSNKSFNSSSQLIPNSPAPNPISFICNHESSDPCDRPLLNSSSSLCINLPKPRNPNSPQPFLISSKEKPKTPSYTKTPTSDQEIEHIFKIARVDYKLLRLRFASFQGEPKLRI